MYQTAKAIYYFLIMFLLGTALFVMQPTDIAEVRNWQAGIKSQLSVAWQQTIGDHPFFADFALIYESVDNFYKLAAGETIALIAEPDSDSDLVYVYSQVYQSLAKTAQPPPDADLVYKTAQITIPLNFMSGEAIYNIVPYRSIVQTIGGSVAGASVASPWVTMQDAVTGQNYCLAVYNGHVNKYLGECKDDYY
ncbi:MAG: hypothetical protein A2660_00440 [Candidatus Doudnabacteria bacterium RIFCSPHIGHO2_01_FULL_45_18]|uniref:Uncharacterized protein n=1 Tax=Candidatus Doudnabacteria bacterium RIFCSPHIGHO2_01_FULL_45_18 TaxID=1817823 RepID=A0A1F5NQE7_9BACT|nr:MAG: hypothetical protein A2660_00440 [Candidatus Doudnabacteria bacterium RIFCSPHIGHO2_01_FULL_45_18]